MALLLRPDSAPAQRPMGTDVSHYQGTINWTTVKNAGVTFAWAKATESTGYTDPYFAINMAGAKAVGIPIGAYHFARPSDNPNLSGTNSADTEAAHFWAVIGGYITNGGTRMVPMLDWEDTGVTVAAGFTTANMSAWVNRFCNTISNYARAKGVIIKPIVYTGVWFSSPNSTYPGLNSSVTIWPSWIAAYPANPNPQSGGPSSSAPWSTWNFWQYADTNWSGGDSDVFKGTAAELAAYIVGGAGPPNFISQPASRYADRGSSLTMTTAAAGGAPLKYQWRFNGTNIANATTSALSLANIQTGSAGGYTVVVTNTSGSITSTVAALTVNLLFTPVFADTFDTNSAANWTVNKSSTDSRVSFAYDYAPYGIPAAPNSAGGTTKGAKFEANISLGAVAALNMSPLGRSFGGNFRLHYDLWINANGPFPAGGTGSSQLQTAGLGTLGNRVQWNSGTADGVWFAIDGEGQGTDTSPDIRAQIGITLQNTNTGVYVGGTNTAIRRCSHPYYANVFPGGQTAPVAQAQTGALETGTVGFAWRDVVVNKTGSTMEWFINGLKIATVTNVSLTASNIFVGYWDPFASLSDNTNLSFALVDNLRVEVPVMAPAITWITASSTITQGSNFTFSAIATGAPAPAYQWRFSGTNLPGATASTYTRVNVQTVDAGSYSLVLTNVGGAITSSPIFLTVNVPPNISLPPADVTTNQGSTATFSVLATGTPALGYQWQRDGTNLADATDSSYAINSVQPADAGYYRVIVTNMAGAATSSAAWLTVNVPPDIATQPQGLTVHLNENASFGVTASGTGPLRYQWRFNATPIAGATESGYTRPNVQTNDVGNYSVVITNLAGSITSSNAVLSLAVTQPSQFQLIELLPDLRVHLVVSGESGMSYLLQVSSNTVDWTTLTNFIHPGGLFNFTDDSATNAATRYYRTQLSP